MSQDESLTGKLLVASPALTDPNFYRTIVLIVRHTAETGAFGIVLNRPIEAVPLVEQLPAWSERAADPPFIFRGGPVEPSVAFALGRFPENALGPEDALLPGVSVVDLKGSPSDLPALESIRVFSGYAGWSPGQLEAEMGESAWFTVEPQLSDLFTTEPGTLWRDVLKRQRGSLAIFAHFPATPNQN